MARYLGARMKIEVREFVLETFIVEVPDDTPESELDEAVEALRVQYTGARSSEVSSVEWEAHATTNEEVAQVLLRYRADYPDVRSFAPGLSQHDLSCWDMYIKGYFPACGLHLNYKRWLAGDEYHNPNEVARVLKEGA